MWSSGGDRGAFGQVGGAANGGKEGGQEQATEQACQTLLASIEEKMRMEEKREDVSLQGGARMDGAFTVNVPDLRCVLTRLLPLSVLLFSWGRFHAHTQTPTRYSSVPGGSGDTPYFIHPWKDPAFGAPVSTLVECEGEREEGKEGGSRLCSFFLTIP